MTVDVSKPFAAPKRARATPRSIRPRRTHVWKGGHITPSEAKRAHQWRKKSGLTIYELAERTGYSPAAIWMMERGRADNGDLLDARVFQRYRMACAGAIANPSFDW